MSPECWINPSPSSFEHGVEPPEVHPDDVARAVAFADARLAAPVGLAPVALGRGRLRRGGEEAAHLLHERLGRGAVGLRRRIADQIHQQSPARHQQRGSLIAPARGRAAEEPAGILQRVRDVAHRREAHHGGVALDRVEASLDRGEQLVARLTVAPAALQLDEGVTHLFGERQALDDVILEQVPEGILLQCHAAPRSRRCSRARRTSCWMSDG